MKISKLFFKRKTVDAVLAQFTKAVAELRAVQSHQEGQAGAYDSAAERFRLACRAAQGEADRARNIAAKIEALLS